METNPGGQDMPLRRSSFVPPTDNSDFTPHLPDADAAFGEERIDFFPAVETSQPVEKPVHQPVNTIPKRHSLSQTELTAVIGDGNGMSSTEQIELLETQMKLRQSDAESALAFLDVIHRALPGEAGRLLSELQDTFGDVAPEILEVSLDGATENVNPDEESEVTPPVESSVHIEPEPEPESEPVQPVAAETLNSDASESVDTDPSEAKTGWQLTVPHSLDDDSFESVDRHRAWDLVLFIAAVVSVIIPLTSAIFSGLANPLPELITEMVGLPGMLATAVAVLVAWVMSHLARRRSTITGNSWRISASETMGKISGTLMVSLASISILAVLTTILLSSASGYEDISKADWFAPVIAALGSNVHASVLIASVAMLVGFVIAALPRSLFRDKLLVLAGASAVGVGLISLMGLGIIATTSLGQSIDFDLLTVAGATLPIAGVMLFASYPAINHITRKDEDDPGLIWVIIGLGIGALIGGGSLLLQLLTPEADAYFAAGNPALRIAGELSPWYLVIGSLSFGLPLVLVSALAGRTVSMATVRDDRRPGWLAIRLILVLLPIGIAALDVTGYGQPVLQYLPGLALLSVPAMALIGSQAGSAVAGFRDVKPFAKVLNAVIAILFTLLGVGLTLGTTPVLSESFAGYLGGYLPSADSLPAVYALTPVAVAVMTAVFTLISTASGTVRSADSK